MIRDCYAAGKLDELSDELLGDSLIDEAQTSLWVANAFQTVGDKEVEIARVALA